MKSFAACANVTSIITLILICSLSASAKDSTVNSEVNDSSKAPLQDSDHEFNSKRDRRGRAYSLRATLPEDEKATGSQTLAYQCWKPLPDTSINTDSSGTFTVTCQNTFWGGVIAYPQVASNYRLDADGKLRAGGSGYGLVVRASVTDGRTPHGQGIQYDKGIGGFRDVLLPDQSESGTVKSATIDSNWHHISVAVMGDRYVSSVDGKVVFSGKTSTDGGEGILIRVWRSTADFRNITVTPITNLPVP